MLTRSQKSQIARSIERFGTTKRNNPAVDKETMEGNLRGLVFAIKDPEHYAMYPGEEILQATNPAEVEAYGKQFIRNYRFNRSETAESQRKAKYTKARRKVVTHTLAYLDRANSTHASVYHDGAFWWLCRDGQWRHCGRCDVRAIWNFTTKAEARRAIYASGTMPGEPGFVEAPPMNLDQSYAAVA